MAADAMLLRTPLQARCPAGPTLDLDVCDVAVGLHQAVAHRQVAWKPIWAFCIDNIVCSIPTSGCPAEARAAVRWFVLRPR